MFYNYLDFIFLFKSVEVKKQNVTEGVFRLKAHVRLNEKTKNPKCFSCLCKFSQIPTDCFAFSLNAPSDFCCTVLQRGETGWTILKY